MKRTIRQIIRKWGLDIIRYPVTDIGQDPMLDMAKFMRSDRPLILDVGANVGQSIGKFRFQFPDCTIHSFEPSPSTFETLSEAGSSLDDVHIWNLAIGSDTEKKTFLENSHSVMSSFLPPAEDGWGEITRETTVKVETIDRFCREKEIEYIDILKSDTQGFDLEVFKGAEQMMRANKIGLIYCEVIFSDMYERLPSFAQIYEFLTQRGFALVSFYDFHYQEQLAGWADALFVHESYTAPQRGLVRSE